MNEELPPTSTSSTPILVTDSSSKNSNWILVLIVAILIAGVLFIGGYEFFSKKVNSNSSSLSALLYNLNSPAVSDENLNYRLRGKITKIDKNTQLQYSTWTIASEQDTHSYVIEVPWILPDFKTATSSANPNFKPSVMAVPVGSEVSLFVVVDVQHLVQVANQVFLIK